MYWQSNAGIMLAHVRWSLLEDFEDDVVSLTRIMLRVVRSLANRR